MTTKRNPKLSQRRGGPYKVTEVVSPYSYRLQLPTTMNRVHNVFHVGLLTPLPSTTPMPGQHNNPPPAVLVNGEDEWLVDAIIDSHRAIKDHEFEYRVQWRGYDEPTWETVDAVANSADVVHQFHDRFPRKARPPTLPAIPPSLHTAAIATAASAWRSPSLGMGEGDGVTDAASISQQTCVDLSTPTIFPSMVTW